MPVTWFDSVADYARNVGRLKNSYTRDETDASFRGGMTFAESISLCWKGRTDLVPAAEAMLEQIDLEHLDLEQMRFQPSVMGAYPVVPEFLAGMPDCMRRRQVETAETAPVRVFASRCGSGGISAKSMLARGTAILAFVMKLSTLRPVELFTFSELSSDHADGIAFPVIRIDAAPLDLSTACHALCSPGFLRCLDFAHTERYGRWDGGWAFSDPRTEAAKQRTRKTLDLNEQDILIPGAYYDDELVQQPLAWLKRELDRFRGRDDSE